MQLIFNFAFLSLLITVVSDQPKQNIIIRHERQSGRGRVPSTGHCVIRINEINTDTNQDTPSLFIELRRLCVTGRKKRRMSIHSLSGYYIVLIRAINPAVTFFANLDGARLKINGHFTLGDSTVPNVDMAFGHGNVMSIYPNDRNVRSLPAGDDSPYALLLIDSQLSSKLARFRLVYNAETGKYIEKPITNDDIQFLISEHALVTPEDPPFLLDMVVYGRKIHVSSCSIFDPLWMSGKPIQGTKRFLLRDWDITGKVQVGERLINVKDYSLNRCTADTDGFTPNVFQYDTPTPGRENPCQGTQFFIEDVIQQIAIVNVVPVDPVPHCSADHPYVPEGRYPIIEEEKLAKVREDLLEEGRSRAAIDCADEAMDIAINTVAISEEPSSHYLRIGGTVWNPDWYETARTHVSSDGMILREREVQHWLRINIPGAQSPVSFHCAACIEFFQDKMGNVINKKNIMTPAGYYHSNPMKNTAEIRKHANNDVHISAMNYQFQLESAATAEQRDAIRKNAEIAFDEKLLPTAKMIRTVFTQVMAEVPFMYHELFVKLQVSNGIELGSHHYHEQGASDMTKTMSNKMHEILLKHLVECNKPFSIIVDASTTSRNVPLLIIYIQTLEDGYPVTYYYKIIDLPKGESAGATFERFWQSVLDDDKICPGFKDFFIRNLAFLVSDSASVMIGIRNSFYTLLRNITPAKALGQVSCMAHKMALVVKAAVRIKDDVDFEYLQKFERSINEFYVFYNSRGSKRFQHLGATAEKYDMRLYRLRKNIEVRWSTAEYEVINGILKDWILLEADLKAIVTDNVNFNHYARLQASNLYTNLTNTGNVVLYHEFIDFLGVNSVISRALQSRASILADHADFISITFAQYYLMKTETGKKMTSFLAAVSCPGVCQMPDCTLPQVEECNEADYIGVKLSKNNEFMMYKIREKFYTNLFNAMDHYFDFELLESMKIFDHRLSSLKPDRKDFIKKFFVVCEKYPLVNLGDPEISCKPLSIKVYDFICEAMTRDLYKTSFGKPGALPPSQFWPFVLQNTDESLVIHDHIRIFFDFLLIHSDSSAEAERGFSFVTRITAGARSGLQNDTLDALLRIKLNANKDIEDLKAFMYARAFSLNHHLVDSKQAGGRHKVLKQNAYMERVSRLF